MDDLQGVRDAPDRDDLEAQFNSTVERAHVTGVTVVGPDPEPEEPEPPLSDEDMAAQIAERVAKEAAKEAAAMAQRRADEMLRIRGLARSVVSEVAALAGQDPCNHHPVLTVIADNIEAQLRNVYEAKPMEQPRGFRHTSNEADLHHAHNIRRAIVGAQG